MTLCRAGTGSGTGGLVARTERHFVKHRQMERHSGEKTQGAHFGTAADPGGGVSRGSDREPLVMPKCPQTGVGAPLSPSSPVQILSPAVLGHHTAHWTPVPGVGFDFCTVSASVLPHFCLPQSFPTLKNSFSGHVWSRLVTFGHLWSSLVIWPVGRLHAAPLPGRLFRRNGLPADDGNAKLRPCA